jgi:hypothetical protein
MASPEPGASDQQEADFCRIKNLSAKKNFQEELDERYNQAQEIWYKEKALLPYCSNGQPRSEGWKNH